MRLQSSALALSITLIVPALLQPACGGGGGGAPAGGGAGAGAAGRAGAGADDAPGVTAASASDGLDRLPPDSRGPGELSGLYFGEWRDFVFVPNISAPGGGSWQYQRRVLAYFFGQGRVCSGVPGGGALDGFDPAAAAAQDPRACGTFTRSASAVEISWTDGSTSSLSLRGGDATSLAAGQHAIMRVRPATGLMLDGTFGFTTFVDVSGPSGGVSGEHAIVFHGGGRFEARHFTGFAGDAGASSTMASGAGHYAIMGNTLTLAFDGGPTVHATFFVHPTATGQAPVQTVVIDGADYLRSDVATATPALPGQGATPGSAASPACTSDGCGQCVSTALAACQGACTTETSAWETCIKEQGCRDATGTLDTACANTRCPDQTSAVGTCFLSQCQGLSACYGR